MKGFIKKYSFRLFAGIMIYSFIHLSHSSPIDEFFTTAPIDIAMFLYTPLVVILIWEGFDWMFNHFQMNHYNYSHSKDLLKAVLLSSLYMVPSVFMASFFSENVIKPFLNYPTTMDTLFKELAQGSIFGWLIIAARIIRENSLQNQQLEQDKSLVQKELLLSQYQNLKNQINPHFLFNSFSVLQSLIDIDPNRATIFLTKLSSMYRYILEKREESMSSVEREIEMLEVYMYLLKTRHESSLDLSVSIDAKYHQCFLPTMSLQMLVENAVKHNLFSKNEPLRITVFVENEYLVVRNAVKRKGARAHSTKIGLENIRSQYELQSDRNVIIVEDENYFTVKIPVLTRLKFA